MAKRVLAGRWSPSKTVTKRQLRNACSATEITPRPNWLHASHEELFEAIAPALEEAGVIVTSRLDKPARLGGRGLYQSSARWGVRREAMDAAPGYFSWDTETGRFHASFPGPRYAAARAAVEDAVRTSEAHASVRREDIRDQLALALMAALPVAPYSPLSHVDPAGHLWVLGVDGPDLNRGRRFLQAAGFPLLDLCELDGPAIGFHQLIGLSLDRAQTRYRTRTGWLAIAKSSHDALMEALS